MGGTGRKRAREDWHDRSTTTCAEVAYRIERLSFRLATTQKSANKKCATPSFPLTQLATKPRKLHPDATSIVRKLDTHTLSVENMFFSAALRNADGWLLVVTDQGQATSAVLSNVQCSPLLHTHTPPSPSRMITFCPPATYRCHWSSAGRIAVRMWPLKFLHELVDFVFLVCGFNLDMAVFRAKVHGEWQSHCNDA